VAPADTYALRFLASLEVAPDGRSLAYVVQTASRKKDSYENTLHLMPAEGGKTRALTSSDADETSPRFSRDGKRLAFLSDKGEGAQIVVARPDGKRRKVVTRIREGVLDFDWAPNGKELVFVRADTPTKRPPDDDPWVITRTLIQRDGEGFLTERRTHVWIVSAEGGEPRQITTGPYDDSEPRWSPDGSWIAFVSNRTPDPDSNDNTDIFVVKPDGSGLRPATANPGPDDTPRWSHSGDRIAFVGGLRHNDFYQARPLMVASLAGGPVLDLSAPLDTWVAPDAIGVSEAREGAVWSSDDRTIYATFERRGATFLAAIPSEGGAPKEILAGPRHVETVRLAPSGDRFFLTLNDATHLPEIHTMGVDGGGLTRLTHLNDAFLAEAKLSVPEKLTARNGSGDGVESWLYPPLDLDPSRKYPFIVYVHGGPQGYDGDYFDSGLENQVFPGAGFAVLRVNYRGSTSYGEKFCRALWGDWHTREYEDLMVSIDEALKQRSWLDPERLGIGGWSYGGIMSIWAVGHTDRFKVAVPERFDVDYLSSFGQDQWFTQYLEELGSPIVEAERYRRLSPGTYVPNIQTPLYLIANEKDGNCPLPQAMQLYQRLRHLGKKTELVIYPGENHSMQRPAHLVDRLERLLRWFGAHLSADAPPPAANPR
jgi:dipeptidyl aminopeptidase/acylaminoacyl peptidase